MQRLAAPRPIKWTDDTAATTIENMRVDYRCADIGMAEKLLYGADVVARFEQVGGTNAPACAAWRA